MGRVRAKREGFGHWPESLEEEKVDEFNGFKRINRFTGKVRRKK